MARLVLASFVCLRGLAAQTVQACGTLCADTLRAIGGADPVPGNLVYCKVLDDDASPFTLRTADGEPIAASVRTVEGDRVFASDVPIAAGTPIVLEYGCRCSAEEPRPTSGSRYVLSSFTRAADTLWTALGAALWLRCRPQLKQPSSTWSSRTMRRLRLMAGAALLFACRYDDGSGVPTSGAPSTPGADSDASAQPPADGSAECSGEWAVACEGCRTHEESASRLAIVDGSCTCTPFAPACFSTTASPDMPVNGESATLLHEASGAVILYPTSSVVPEGFVACEDLDDAPPACACGAVCP